MNMKTRKQKLGALDFKVTKLPRRGSYRAFKIEVWNQGQKQVSVICKLTNTELIRGLVNKVVRDETEAMRKLRRFALSEAKSIYRSRDYTERQTITKFFSPFW